MADHEDYLPGEAPMPHAASHESLGSDEISVAGLHGALADDQPCLAHDLGGTKHVADSLADLNTKVSDATLEDKTVLENTMDAKVATHAALPTVHQDAPALIATHTALPSAHHAKYTDAEARALMSPISVNFSAFYPSQDTYDWYHTTAAIVKRVSLTGAYFVANVNFPDGVTVTKVTLYGYRNDALSSMTLSLIRNARSGAGVDMASITSDWTSGWSSKYDDSIVNAVIDNDNYSYYLRANLDPNDSVWDCQLNSVKIEFTG